MNDKSDISSINKEEISILNQSALQSNRKPSKNDDLISDVKTDNSMPNQISDKNISVGLDKHIEALSKSLKQYKKKKFLMNLTGKQFIISSPPKEPENHEEPPPRSKESFLLEYFFDEQQLNRPKPHELPEREPKEVLLDDHVTPSYFPLSSPPLYDPKNIFFVDFVCNSKYITQDAGSEGGESKKITESSDIPKSSEEANLTLSANVDYHSIEYIQYLRKLKSYLDPEDRINLIKSSHTTNDQDLFEYIVDQKMSLDHKIRFYEDCHKFVYRPPLSLSLDNSDDSYHPTFNLHSLHFLYYVLVYFETKSSLTPHAKRPITKIMKHVIPLLYGITEPQVLPYKETQYYNLLKLNLEHASVSTSLTPFFVDGTIDQEINHINSFSPEYNIVEKDWNCHLVLPSLHLKFLITLFDLLDALDEYLSTVRFIPFRSAFALNEYVRSDLTLESFPHEFKRFIDSVDRGGSLCQKLYDLRNISYQLITTHRFHLFDRELQIIREISKKKIVDPEKEFLEKLKYEIIDQKPYSVHFSIANNRIGLKYNKADLSKTSNGIEFNYVFPNYSINFMQAKYDSSIVKYDGVLSSDMVFDVSGALDSDDDRIHVHFVDGSYGIICNYTELV